MLEKLKEKIMVSCYEDRAGRSVISVKTLMEIIDQLAAEQPDWIACSEALPPPETEVLIRARRKFSNGDTKDIITTAFYEDGTVRENNSDWRWEDIDGEWDEDEDCLIIPEGWWEYRHFNADEVYNNAVDAEVIEWRPLPEGYLSREE